MDRPKRADATPIGYLYVACVGIGCHGCQTGIREGVKAVPIVRKTAKLIFYASDSWDRREAVVSPGCISREQFETDTRCRDHGDDPCRHGYPPGVIPVPGHRHGTGPAGRLFFASREAAESAVDRRKGERAERGRAGASPIRELRRAMADAHPDRGGSAEQFIEARGRYEAALRADAA